MPHMCRHHAAEPPSIYKIIFGNYNDCSFFWVDLSRWRYKYYARISISWIDSHTASFFETLSIMPTFPFPCLHPYSYIHIKASSKSTNELDVSVITTAGIMDCIMDGPHTENVPDCKIIISSSSSSQCPR